MSAAKLTFRSVLLGGAVVFAGLLLGLPVIVAGIVNHGFGLLALGTAC